jgi:hypothetical protein
MNRCWILLMAFSACIERINWFLSLLYSIYRFAYVEPPLHPWDEPTWSWLMIFLMCCWIQFAIILLRIFALMFIKEIGL